MAKESGEEKALAGFIQYPIEKARKEAERQKEIEEKAKAEREQSEKRIKQLTLNQRKEQTARALKVAEDMLMGESPKTETIEEWIGEPTVTKDVQKTNQAQGDDWLERNFTPAESKVSPAVLAAEPAQPPLVEAPLEAKIEPPSNRGIKSIMYTNYIFPEIDAESMKSMTTEAIFQKTVRGSEFKLITAKDNGNYSNDDGDLKFTCIRDAEGALSFNYTQIKNGSIIIPNQTNDGRTCDVVVIQDGKVVKFLDGNGGLDNDTAERLEKEARENAHLYADAVKQEAAAAQAVSAPQPTVVERVAEVFTSAKDVLMETVRKIVDKVEKFTIPEHHAALKAEMEQKVAQGELEKAAPRISSKEALPGNAVRVTEYGEGEASLKKTEWRDGTYTFEAGSEFTGVIKMPRKGDDGRLLESFDWVQFVDGKVVKDGVIEGLGGKSIIANLGELKQRAGITVAPPEAHAASVTLPIISSANEASKPQPTPPVQVSTAHQHRGRSSSTQRRY